MEGSRPGVVFGETTRAPLRPGRGGVLSPDFCEHQRRYQPVHVDTKLNAVATGRESVRGRSIKGMKPKVA